MLATTSRGKSLPSPEGIKHKISCRIAGTQEKRSTIVRIFISTSSFAEYEDIEQSGVLCSKCNIKDTGVFTTPYDKTLRARLVYRLRRVTNRFHIGKGKIRQMTNKDIKGS